MNHAWKLALLAAALSLLVAPLLGCHNTGLGGDPFAGRTRIDAPPTGSLGGNPYLSGSGVPGGSTLQPPTITGPNGTTSMYNPWSGAPATGYAPATGAPAPTGWGYPNPWGQAPATAPQPAMPSTGWNTSQPSSSFLPGFLQPRTWGTPGQPVQPVQPTQPSTGWQGPSGTQMFPSWPQPTSAPAPPPGTSFPYPGHSALPAAGTDSISSAAPPGDATLGWRNPAGGVSPASFQAPVAAPTAPPVVSGPEVGGLSREPAPLISGPSSALVPVGPAAP